MNCNECKDLLIEFSEDLLDANLKETIEQHLEACSECRKEAESILALQDRLLKNGQGSHFVDLEVRVMDRISREQNARLKAYSSAGFYYQIRSFLMKNTLLKIAAAAVIVLVVLISLNFPQDNVTFAQVAEPILHARTLEYDLAIGELPIMFHDIVVEDKIRRSDNTRPWVAIMDVDNSSAVRLDTVHKIAVTLTAETEETKVGFDINRDFLRLVRSAVETALNGTPSVVKKLGKKTIDGHGVYGFKLQSGTDGEEVVIWADRDTALPIEIDIRLGISHPDSLAAEKGPSIPGKPALQIVRIFPKNFLLKNIRFDVLIDESLMEMPSDYKLVDKKQFMDLIMENDFVNMLHLWSEKLSDGFFPENLPPVNIRNQFASAFPDSIKWTPEEREELITDEVLKTSGLGHVAKEFLINLNPEEWEDAIINAFYGLGFISSLEINGVEWRYSGSGVRLGKGTSEIFRYMMPDASSWRLIYGDLHVEEIPAENAR